MQGVLKRRGFNCFWRAIVFVYFSKKMPGYGYAKDCYRAV